ncbi:MAG: hypothetical protein RLZZ308_645 [Candidatus Parcubacteria bacterium]
MRYFTSRIRMIFAQYFPSCAEVQMGMHIYILRHNLRHFVVLPYSARFGATLVHNQKSVNMSHMSISQKKKSVSRASRGRLAVLRQEMRLTKPARSRFSKRNGSRK